MTKISVEMAKDLALVLVRRRFNAQYNEVVVAIHGKVMAEVQRIIEATEKSAGIKLSQVPKDWLSPVNYFKFNVKGMTLSLNPLKRPGNHSLELSGFRDGGVVFAANSKIADEIRLPTPLKDKFQAYSASTAFVYGANGAKDADELADLMKRQAALEEQSNATFRSIIGTLKAMKTVEAMLETWPDVKELIPPGWATKTPGACLPVPIAKLNEILGLPPDAEELKPVATKKATTPKKKAA